MYPLDLICVSINLPWFWSTQYFSFAMFYSYTEVEST